MARKKLHNRSTHYSESKAVPTKHGQIHCKYCGRRNRVKTAVTVLKRTILQQTHSATNENIHSVCKDSDSSDAEYVLSVKDHKVSTDKEIDATMILNGVEVKFQLVCGATVNMLPQKYVKSADLQPTDKPLHMWNGTELIPLGKCHTYLNNLKIRKKYSIEFTVVNKNT